MSNVTSSGASVSPYTLDVSPGTKARPRMPTLALAADAPERGRRPGGQVDRRQLAAAELDGVVERRDDGLGGRHVRRGRVPGGAGPRRRGLVDPGRVDGAVDAGGARAVTGVVVVTAGRAMTVRASTARRRGRRGGGEVDRIGPIAADRSAVGTARRPDGRHARWQ